MKQNPTCAKCAQEKEPNIAHFCNGPVFNSLPLSWPDLKTKADLNYIIGYLEGLRSIGTFTDPLLQPVQMLKKIVGQE